MRGVPAGRPGGHRADPHGVQPVRRALRAIQRAYLWVFGDVRKEKARKEMRDREKGPR